MTSISAISGIPGSYGVQLQGVSHDDLIAAIKAGRPTGAPQDPGGRSDDERAEPIADRQGMPGGGPGAPAGRQDSAKVQQLRTLLGGDTGGLLNTYA